MSQIYKPLTSTGPIPPTIATTYTTDDGSIAIPAANNLNVLSTAVTTNNINGIQTRAVAPNSSNLFIELTNRLFGGISSIDASQATIIIFPLSATPAVYTFDGIFSGLNTTVPSGASFFFTAGARTDGTTASILGSDFSTKFVDGGMTATNVNIIPSGNSLLFVVFGIAANNITWLSQVTYSRSP
jgi:hypothetical protein